MLAVYKQIAHAAQSEMAVLVTGETGTGKELVARAIHRHSGRKEQPFVAVNCGALAESLLESELFGHVRGSFTGAVNDRKGRFELAGEGTIFLDEIGDTSPAFQTKLLRVLQEREFYPIGGEKPRQTHARVIAATHRPMEQLIREGRFREDLYFRLRVVEISIPPLRERRRDVPLLAEHILARVGADVGKPLHVPDDTMGVLLAHGWPGNVRELENALTRAVVLSQGEVLEARHLPMLDGVPAGSAAAAAGATTTTSTTATTASASASSPTHGDGELLSLREVERRHVEHVLAAVGWNKRRACAVLEISRPTLDRKIDDFGLSRPGVAGGDEDEP
jgi:DNA-binding NtrC family response regulator